MTSVEYRGEKGCSFLENIFVSPQDTIKVACMENWEMLYKFYGDLNVRKIKNPNINIFTRPKKWASTNHPVQHQRTRSGTDRHEPCAQDRWKNMHVLFATEYHQ